MGLLIWLALLLGGVVLLANDTTWFPGEDTVAFAALVLAFVVLMVDVVTVLFVRRKMKRMRRNFWGGHGF